ncbi:hypothetical protein ACTNBL_05975 [Enterococcus villorum]|uniref:hypothetical protein n=1 Tax=Enterococcus villorum TaxID=112904 RepID=UPI003F8B2F0B
MTNKFLKYFLCFLFILVTIAISFSKINQQNLNKTVHTFNHTTNYSPLRVPKIFVQESEYRQLIFLFETLSLKNDIPYMKKVTNESNEIKEGFNFKIRPKLEITFYYQNQKEPTNFKLPFSNTRFLIENIQQSITKKEFEGEFFLLTSDKEKYEIYAKGFAKGYNKIFQTTYEVDVFSDFNNELNYSPISSTDLYHFSSYVQIGILFFVFALGSYYFILIKEIHLLSNYGFSVKHIMHTLIGKTTMFFLLCVVSIESFLMWKMFREQFLPYTFLLTLLLGGSYFISLIFIYLIIKLPSMKKRLKYLQFLTFTVTLLFSFILAITSTNLSEIILATTNLWNTYEVPSEIVSENYEVFYPLTIGKNHIEFIYANQLQKHMDDSLYESLNEQGSILVNLSDYHIKENKIFGRGIKVNPNYLKKFQILDEKGERIYIDEQEQKHILLIPERYKEKDLRNELEEVISYYNDFYQQKTKVYYIQDNQSIYTFTLHDPWIDDYPFIEILTLKNSTFWERNIINGDSSPPLKVKADPTNRKKILKLVEKNQLSDNLQLLFPYTKAEEIVVKMISKSLGQLISIFIVTMISFISLSFLVLSILFIYNKRTIALLRLSGFSLLSTYRTLFIQIFFKWGLATIFMFIFWESDLKIIINMIIFIMIDLSMTIVFLLYIEKKNNLFILSGW